LFIFGKRSISLKKNVKNIERIFYGGFVGRKFSVKPAAALPRIVFSRMRIKVEGGGVKLVTTASPSDTKRRNERFRVGNKGRESNVASVSRREKPNRANEAR